MRCCLKVHKKKSSLLTVIKMDYTDKQIVETYANMFEGLSSSIKVELIERLSKSLKVETATKDEVFYKSFGAFASEKSAEEIIKDLRSARKFKQRKTKL